MRLLVMPQTEENINMLLARSSPHVQQATKTSVQFYQSTYNLIVRQRALLRLRETINISILIIDMFINVYV